MGRSAFAALSIAAGLIVGVGGDLLFNGKAIGISFLLFIALCMVALLISARVAREPINRRNLWIVVPMLFFAAMLAVRADSVMSAVNTLITFYIGAIVLFYLVQPARIDQETVSQHNAGAIAAGMGTILSPFGVIPSALEWSRGALRGDNASKNRMWLVAIVRGLLIAAPLVLVFLVLFASADTVFNDFITRIWNALNLASLSNIIEHGMIIGLIGWLAAGGIAFAIARKWAQPAPSPDGITPDVEGVPDAESEKAEAIYKQAVAHTAAARTAQRSSAKPKKKRTFTLGIIEAIIVLASVDVLFGVFVIFQFAYFFGGQTALVSSGFTYADYARRGFFELMAVSALTLGLVLWLDWVTVRSDARQKLLFRILASIIVALTGVILLSAANRMLLYEEAYGFTHLRVYVHVVIYWMGALFIAFLLALYRVRERIFSLGVLIVIIGIVWTLNLMNVDQYIAERNIARFFADEPLDMTYLNTLSTDAVPAMIDFYHALEDDTTMIYGYSRDVWSYYPLREGVGQWLRRQLVMIDRANESGSTNTIFSTHASRTSAYALLDGMRDDLPAYSQANSYSFRSSELRRGDTIPPTVVPAAVTPETGAILPNLSSGTPASTSTSSR